MYILFVERDKMLYILKSMGYFVRKVNNALRLDYVLIALDSMSVQ